MVIGVVVWIGNISYKVFLSVKRKQVTRTLLLVADFSLRK